MTMKGEVQAQPQWHTSVMDTKQWKSQIILWLSLIQTRNSQF